MRWKITQSPSAPKEGDTRLKKYFAFLPVTIKDQTRWLEKVTIVQSYDKYEATFCPYVGMEYKYMWKNIQFTTPFEKTK